MLLPRCPGCMWLKQLETDTSGAHADQLTIGASADPGSNSQEVRIVW